MRLLDRYLLRELFIPLAYCLAGFLIFWVASDILSELHEFQELKMGVGDVGAYYLIRAPELLVTIMPIALLLALLYALTNHARHQEITAIRAAGVSLWRLSLPYFGVGIVFSLGLFLLNEFWVPYSEEAADRFRTAPSERNARAAAQEWVSGLHFRNARHGRFWNIGAYNVRTGEMRDPQIEWSVADGASCRLLAQSAMRTNGFWRFFEVQQITYPPGAFDPVIQRKSVLDVPEFSETPEQIQSEIKISRLNRIAASRKVQLSLQEILNYLRLHPDLAGKERALLQTQLHARLAAPWTCLVVVLIALPFGAASGRRNVFVGVASSIMICFVFFLLLRFGLALGTGGFMPPWLAAWLPNLLFGGAGVLMTKRVR